jgi:hypothetical protein
LSALGGCPRLGVERRGINTSLRVTWLGSFTASDS